MSARLIALRKCPATVPAIPALVLFVIWETNQTGYSLTQWAPGALIVMALLAIAVAVIGVKPREMPLSVRVAIGAFVLYTALSYLSILWATVPGDAWEGANRTLLYLLVFTLFASWRQEGFTGAMLIVGWAIATVGVAVGVALHVDRATAGQLASFLPEGRLVYPSGYANSAAAQWLIAFWPSLILAGTHRVDWRLRGALAGGAVLLADMALLSLSRGALYSMPIVLLLVFVMLPGRLRTFAVLIPVAIGIGVGVPTILEVGNNLSHGLATTGAVHKAMTAIFTSAGVVACLVALAASLESRSRPAPATVARLRALTTAAALLCILAIISGGLVAAGNPVTRLEHAWKTFSSSKGYAANSSGNRLTSGLGSQRYDFYRVALDEFLAHPVLGIGVDNFRVEYLAHGRSTETPRYPHSVELRVLSQTGVIGALLALVGLAGALFAGWRAIRATDPLIRAVAAGALAGFTYWLVHGSLDWFWEFAGLAGPAFALLGLACALAPRAALSTVGAMPEESHLASSRLTERYRFPLRTAAVTGSLLVLLLMVASVSAPWLSAVQIQRAAAIWTKQPEHAYDLLDDAASLDPLSAEPYLVAGSISLRFNNLSRADHEFQLGLARSPDDSYATLERGAIASAEGNTAAANKLLFRARRLSPRDANVQAAIASVREGRRVNIQALNYAILREAQLFGP